MTMNFKTLAALCAAAFAITGCSGDNGSDSPAENPGNVSDTSSNQNVSSDIDSSSTENSVSPEQATCKINFSDEKIEVTGTNASVSGNVLTISGKGIFDISGKSSDAKIIIQAGNKDAVTLLLNGVDLTSKNGSVIDCEKSDSLSVVLAENTQNTLSDTTNYTFEDGEDEPDAAVFSRADTIFSGSGKLTINGNYKDGLKCKDGLLVQGGTIEILSADDGITGKDFVTISGGDIIVNADGDGIKSTHDTDEKRGYVTVDNGNITINSGSDGIQAETVLTVNGGSINIKSGGDEADKEISTSRDFLDFDKRDDNFRPGGINRPGTMPFDNPENIAQTGSSTSESETSDSMKGLKAGKNIVISGGEINITAADDSVHSNGGIEIKNGSLKLSSCDDGIHADETLKIGGGNISITKSYEALEGKNIEISGGDINIKAVDDGLNAAGGDNGSYLGFDSSVNNYYLSISGGNIIVDAGGDGLDSNGTIALSGGYVVVYGPTGGGNGAIDYEKSFAVSGGEMIALGDFGMAQAPSTLSQPCLSIRSNVSENSRIEVRDSSGNVIMSTTTPKVCTSLIFTSDKFKSGESYSIYADDKLLSTVTATDGISGGGADSSGGFGGHGGQRPNNPVFNGEGSQL